MTLKNNRAPLQCYFKLWASFCSHWWIQTGVTVRKRPIWVKFGDFYSRVTLKFDEWPWKINTANLRDLIAATGLVISNWIQIVNFFARVTVTFVGWPRKTIGHFFYTASSFVHHFKLDFTVQKHSIRVDIAEMLCCVTLKFDGWPWQTIGHLFYASSSFVQHFVAIGEFKLELQSGKAQFGSNSTIFRAVWPWNLTYDLQQGKSEEFDSCDRPSNLAQIWSKSSIFCPLWPWNLMDGLGKQ